MAKSIDTVVQLQEILRRQLELVKHVASLQKEVAKLAEAMLLDAHAPEQSRLPPIAGRPVRRRGRRRTSGTDRPAKPPGRTH
jgi:hypothetical protein